MQDYKVTATLELRDLVGPQLMKLYEGIDKLEKKTVQLQRRLRNVGSESAGIREAGAAVRAMQRDFLKAEQNLIKMSGAFKTFNGGNAAGGIKSISGEFQRAQASAALLNGELSGIGIQIPGLRDAASAIGRMDRNLASAARNANSLTGHLHGVANAVRGIPNMPNFPRGGGRGSGGGSGGRGGSGGLHGGNLHAGPGGIGIGGVGMALGGPVGVAAVAGYAGFEGAASLFDAGRDYENAFMRFKALNLGDKVNSEADQFVKASKHFGVSNTEMMRVLSEGVGLFGTFDEAKKFAPQIAELSVANGVIYGDKVGALDEKGIGGLLKFIDRRGGFKDEESFRSNLNLAEQIITGSGGRITFEDLDAFSQRGGTAFRGLTADGIREMAGLIIEQKGSAAGVGVMSMYQNLIAGRTPKKTMAMLQDMGLGTLEMQTHGSVGGKPLKSMVLTGLENEELLRTRPVQWMHDVLLPHIKAYEEKKGLASDDQTDLKLINDVLSNRTGSNSGSIMTMQHLQMIRDYTLNQNSQTADQAETMFKGSASGAQIEFQKSWESFKSVFGESILPNTIKILDATTAMIKSFTDFNGKAAALQAAAPKESAKWGPFGTFLGMSPSETAAATSASGSSAPNPVAAPNGQPMHFHFTTKLDSKVIADSTVTHIVRGMASNLGTGQFDFNVGMPSIGMK